MLEATRQPKGKSMTYSMTFKNRAISVHGDKYNYDILGVDYGA